MQVSARKCDTECGTNIQAITNIKNINLLLTTESCLFSSQHWGKHVTISSLQQCRTSPWSYWNGLILNICCCRCFMLFFLISICFCFFKKGIFGISTHCWKADKRMIVWSLVFAKTDPAGSRSLFLHIVGLQKKIYSLSNYGLSFFSLHLPVRDHHGLHRWRDAVPLVHGPAIFSLHRVPRHHPPSVHPERNWHPEIHQVSSTCLTLWVDMQLGHDWTLLLSKRSFGRRRVHSRWQTNTKMHI